jgi:hypothetical protein
LDSEPEPHRDRGDGEEGDSEDDGGDRGEGEGDARRKRRGGDAQEEDEDVEMAESSTGGKEISAAEVRKALQEVARGERVRIPLRSILSFYNNWPTGIPRTRSGGRIVDGSRPGRSRRSRDAARTLGVLQHIHIQSAVPVPCTPTTCRRGHGRPFPRTFPF